MYQGVTAHIHHTCAPSLSLLGHHTCCNALACMHTIFSMLHATLPQSPHIRIRHHSMAAPLAVHAAILDLDGTLVNTLGDFDAALNAMLAELHLPAIERPHIARLVGRGSENLVQQTLLHVGLDESQTRTQFDAAYASYQRHYGYINGQHSTLFAGVREGLHALHRTGIPLACVTNKPLTHAHTLLQRLELLTYFAHVFGGDSFERKKPDPLPLLHTCERLHSTPAQTVMIGDSANDAQAAHAAGCPVLLLGYGYNHGQPIANVPAHGYLNSLADLCLESIPTQHGSTLPN